MLSLILSCNSDNFDLVEAVPASALSSEKSDNGIQLSKVDYFDFLDGNSKMRVPALTKLFITGNRQSPKLITPKLEAEISFLEASSPQALIEKHINQGYLTLEDGDNLEKEASLIQSMFYNQVEFSIIIEHLKSRLSYYKESSESLSSLAQTYQFLLLNQRFSV